MIKTGIGILIKILLILLSIISGKIYLQEINVDPVEEWAKNNAMEITTLEASDQHDDLLSLNDIIGDASLVCLGESRHDIREQFQLKHRFIKYLVEEMGFTTFALEASLPFAERINKYILGHEGDIEKIMEEMPGWFLWDTEEMAVIITWMREYNNENNDKVHFCGIDIVAPDYGLSRIFEYLKKVDARMLNDYNDLTLRRDIINDDFWPTTLEQYKGLTFDEKKNLRSNYDHFYQQIIENEAAYVGLSSRDEYNWILRLTYCALEANKMFSAENRMQMGLIR
jgi:hypothetical protein